MAELFEAHRAKSRSIHKQKAGSMTIIEPNIKYLAPVRKASFSAKREGKPTATANVNRTSVLVKLDRWDSFYVKRDDLAIVISLLEHARDEIVDQEVQSAKWASKTVVELIEADAA